MMLFREIGLHRGILNWNGSCPLGCHVWGKMETGLYLFWMHLWQMDKH